MKAIKYRISGQRKIVTGFADLNPDPEATRENIKGELEKTLEAKAVTAAVTELEPYIKMMSDAIRDRNQAVKDGNLNQADVHHAKYEQRYDEYSVKQKKIIELKPAYKKKYAELARAGAVYFEPGLNQVAANLAQYNSVSHKFYGYVDKDHPENNVAKITDIEALELNEDLTFQVVQDFSGRTYWLFLNERWESHYVDLVGEPLPENGILDADITELQRQDIETQELTDKILGMTAAEKAAELAIIEDQLATEAAAMRGKLEIKGVSTALTDSQSWYQAELATLTNLYA